MQFVLSFKNIEALKMLNTLGVLVKNEDRRVGDADISHHVFRLRLVCSSYVLYTIDLSVWCMLVSLECL